MTSATSRTRTLLAAAAVALAALALYSGTLRNGFVYDDLVIVENNPGMREPANIPRLLTPRYFHISGERTFRPLNTLTYITDMAVWNGRAAGFHFTNMALHTACAALLFFVILRLTRERLPAMLGALLFAAHPLNTEAVSAISFREDMLALLFTLAGLIAYARWREGSAGRGAGLAALAAASLIGLAGKESAAILPLAIAAYDWIAYPDEKFAERARRMAPAVAAVGVACAAFFALYLYLGRFSGGGAAAPPGGSPEAALPVMAQAFARYVYMFLGPFELCADYSQKYEAVWGAASVAGAVLAGLLCVCAPAARRILPCVSFGIFFFLFAFAPVSNIVPFGAVFSERYAYMTNAGLCMAAAALLLERPRGFALPGPRVRSGYAVFLALICLGFGAMTVQRTAVWRDSVSLWSDTIACCPDCARPYVNLGQALLERGRAREARVVLEEARGLDPINFQAWIALGRAYADLGRSELAIHAYQNAIRLDPKVKYTYYNLGLVHHENKQYHLAAMNLMKAIKLDPHYLDARLALANTLFDKRRLSPPKIELLKINLARIRDALPPSDPRRIQAEENSRILMQALDR